MWFVPFILLLLLPLSAYALPVPERYELECGTSFDCPRGLERRIDFWVEIFGKYDNNSAVFHHREFPERVYSVIKREGACGGRSTPPEIEKERSRIKSILNSVADKKAKGEKLNKTEKDFANLFRDESVADIRAAAGAVRCQSGNATRFREAVGRFGRYHQMVAEALHEYGLPEGIQYLPFVESAYNAKAYSRVGAAGLWQLMPETARHLGLQVNPVLDERMDPEIATLGAIRYLQRSFEVLAPVARELKPNVEEAEVYPFVVTSYNYGVAGMKRALLEVGADFIKMLNEYKGETFQVAVKNFYASFLAARYVAGHAEKFFWASTRESPVKVEKVVMDKARKAQTLSRYFDLPIDTLREYNPALTSGVWKGQHLVPRGYVLNLPNKIFGSWDKKMQRLAKLPADQPPRRQEQYRVKRGDVACLIAEKFKVSCKELIAKNKLGKRAIVRIGQILTIPGGSMVIEKPVLAARERIFGDRVFSTAAILDGEFGKGRTRPKRYVVAEGDTPCEVAEKFEISCRELLRANSMQEGESILVGQVMRIPGKLVVAQAGRLEPVSGKAEPTVALSKGREIEQDPVEESIMSLVLRWLGVSGEPATGGNEKVSSLRVASVETGVRQEPPQPKPVSKPEIKPAPQQTTRVEPAKQQVAMVEPPHGDLEKLAAEETSKVTVPQAESGMSGDSKTPAGALEPGGKGDQQLSAAEIAASFGSTDDLYAQRQTKNGKARWIIHVEASETLGHYADWLGIGFSKSIRELNGLKPKENVHMGQSLVLPINDEAEKRKFEENRIGYHRSLQEQFLEHYRITGKQEYAIKSGDSGWTIAQENELPLWLLKRFNPDIFTKNHQIGEVVILPVVKSK